MISGVAEVKAEGAVELYLRHEGREKHLNLLKSSVGLSTLHLLVLLSVQLSFRLRRGALRDFGAHNRTAARRHPVAKLSEMVNSEMGRCSEGEGWFKRHSRATCQRVP